MHDNQHTSSSEELFIEYYLENLGLKYIKEYKVSNLKGDSKSFRKVDFYLPRLDIYVEYFGLYNSTKGIRSAYDEKAKVYIKNHMPTIFLYPHELGFLDYAFHTKMLKVLREKKFKNNLKTYRYKIVRYREKGRANLIFGVMLWWYLLYSILNYKTGLSDEFEGILNLLIFAATINYTIDLINNLTAFFWYDE